MRSYILDLLHNASFTTAEIIRLAAFGGQSFTRAEIEAGLAELEREGLVELIGGEWERRNVGEPERPERKPVKETKVAQRSLFDVCE